ncbi:Hypothetical predicted protein [Cloeon dipterum]|uniref:Uncharacterized protein n=1 Tax=Cloeon dipterum TaxID=197152 RepID=A0A8S1DEE9_9INSE|nr:Hypothetical predicted protein [Cloeon dipterum]
MKIILASFLIVLLVVGSNLQGVSAKPQQFPGETGAAGIPPPSNGPSNLNNRCGANQFFFNNKCNPIIISSNP